MSKSLVIFLSIIGALTFGFINGSISSGQIITGLTFLGVLGVLVYIHEAGHFITARRNKVTCHEFGFGFPPRIGGFVKDDKTGKRRFIWGNEEYYGNNTLFSWNWIPLGGFVRIKGENADPTQKEPEKDSFGAQSIWVRYKILIAGVVMNFLLGWGLLTAALMVGLPLPTSTDNVVDPSWIVGEKQVLVNDVVSDSPASVMGIGPGDALSQMCASGACIEVLSEQDVIDFVSGHLGQAITVDIMRGDAVIELSGVLRATISADEVAFGVSMAQVAIVKMPFHVAIVEGFLRAVSFMWLILGALVGLFGALFKGLYGFITGNSAILSEAGKVSEGVSGPIGIAQMTGQMRDLGFAFLLNFSAILSLNLAIFNALPIPALDGGRILFLLIEKCKGSPVNPKTEGLYHTIFFTILILLMLVVTVKELLGYIAR